VRSWWEIQRWPNVMLLHFAAGGIRRIAAFLDIAIDEARFPTIDSSFDCMKRSAAKALPLGGAFREGGAQTFITRAPTAAGATC
jgi:aryl sulfotransferase